MNTSTPFAERAAFLLVVAISCCGFRSYFNEGSGHYELTREAVSRVFASRTVDGGFTEDALFDIGHHSENPDQPWYAYAEEDHFDDESFFTTSKRRGAPQKILDDRADVLRFARGGVSWAARRSLGEALHTISDFYSHSSWTESHSGSAPHDELAKFLAVIAPPAELLEPGCDNIGRFNGSQRVTTAYYREEHAVPYPPFFAPPEPPPGSPDLRMPKCVHGPAIIRVSGAEVTSYGTNWLGPAYDRDDPQTDRHRVAARVAVDAMTKFVQGIVDELESTRSPGDDRAVCTLFGQPINLCDRATSADVEIWRLDKVLVGVTQGATFTFYSRSNGQERSRVSSEGSASVTIGEIICREGTRWVPKSGNPTGDERGEWSLDEAGNVRAWSDLTFGSKESGVFQSSKQEVSMNLNGTGPYSGHASYHSQYIDNLSPTNNRTEVSSSTIPERTERSTNNAAIAFMVRQQTLPAGSVLPASCWR